MYCAVGIVKENLDNLQCSAGTVPLMNVHLYCLRDPAIDINILHVDHASIIWTSAVRFYFLISSEFQLKGTCMSNLGSFGNLRDESVIKQPESEVLIFLASIVVRSFRFSISCRRVALMKTPAPDIIVIVIVMVVVIENESPGRGGPSPISFFRKSIGCDGRIHSAQAK